MLNIDYFWKRLVGAIIVTSAAVVSAQADEIIKLGLSVPLSGAGANWGIGSEWACKEAAKEVAQGGGVKVGGKVYNFTCIAYDNKYNAAEGTKVAQILLNRDGVKFISASIGTAPVRALQSLSEREGVLLFTVGWGSSLKGPKFPLTFTLQNTPYELSYPLIRAVKEANPGVKTVALLNPNDATGQETEPIARKAWAAAGIKVVSSDWYERGTTQFQPIAAKMAGQKPDVVDLGTAPPGDSGVVFKEIKVLGWNGVKVVPAGTSAEAMMKIGGDSVEGVYMGLSADFDGPEATPVQRKLNVGMKAATGEPINVIQIGGYDAVMALKAGMEAANSLEPKAIAAVLPKIVFDISYGKSAFGGKATYGSPQHMLVPVVITQVKGGKLVEVERAIPEELAKRLASAKK